MAHGADAHAAIESSAIILFAQPPALGDDEPDMMIQVFVDLLNQLIQRNRATLVMDPMAIEYVIGLAGEQPRGLSADQLHQGSRVGG